MENVILIHLQMALSRSHSRRLIKDIAKKDVKYFYFLNKTIENGKVFIHSSMIQSFIQF